MKVGITFPATKLVHGTACCPICAAPSIGAAMVYNCGLTMQWTSMQASDLIIKLPCGFVPHPTESMKIGEQFVLTAEQSQRFSNSRCGFCNSFCAPGSTYFCGLRGSWVQHGHSISISEICKQFRRSAELVADLNAPHPCRCDDKILANGGCICGGF